MKDMDLSLVLKDLAQKRDAKINLHEAKKKEVHLKIPRLEAIDREIFLLGPKAIMLAVSKDLTKSKALQDKIKTLAAERIQILNEANIDFDYFSPKWDCSKCEDRGYIDGVKCSCLRAKLINMRYQNSNISALLSYQNFNTFDLNLYSDFEQNDKSPRYYASLNYKFAKNFCEHFSKAYENIFISGMPGTGKTFLCSCIAKDVLDKGFSVIYMTSYNLITEYNKIKFDKIDKSLDDYVNCDLLIIDDLGSENRSDYNNSIIFQIINDRINRKKPIVISSNFSIKEIQNQYKGRIASRLSSKDFAKLKFIGKDLRI